MYQVRHDGKAFSIAQTWGEYVGYLLGLAEIDQAGEALAYTNAHLAKCLVVCAGEKREGLGDEEWIAKVNDLPNRTKVTLLGWVQATNDELARKGSAAIFVGEMTGREHDAMLKELSDLRAAGRVGASFSCMERHLAPVARNIGGRDRGDASTDEWIAVLRECPYEDVFAYRRWLAGGDLQPERPFR
jgi:hypothetical protein